MDLQDIRNEVGIVQSFCKHGHLIRHLKIHHPILIDAAFLGGACANLLSLEVFYLSNWTTKDTVTTNFGRVILDPIFRDVLVQDPLRNQDNSQKIRDWLTVQRFWLLVRQNAHSLQRLRLDQTIDGLARLISADFFRESILMLKNLTQLHNEFKLIDVAELLDRLPNLQRLVTPGLFVLPSSRPIPLANIKPSFRWKTTPSHLRSVQLLVSIQARTFFMILAHLPGLVSLTVFSIQGDGLQSQEIHMITRGKPSNLQTLRTTFSVRYYHSVEKVILLWLPRLRRIFCTALLDAVVADLVRHCPLLEEYHYSVHGGSIFTSSVQTSNIPNILLRGCPNLRVFNGLPHRIRAAEFGKEPWAATNLEIFRAQILCVSRLTVDEERIIDRVLEASVYGQQLSDKNTALLEKFHASRRQQKQILERLGSLTRLRELDFGYEYRDLWIEKTSFDPMASFPTRAYRPYGGPIFDTLELSLQMGLQQLARLKELEVFGFGGANHRITERELRWMPEKGPKLKMMRGLKLRELKDAQPDRRMDQLRNFMISLRPRVEHPMLGAEQ